MSWTLFLLLVKASGLTVAISAIAIVIGLTLGMVVSAGMLSPNLLLSMPSRVFVSFFRGVPLLVQLLLIYNLLPLLGLNVPSVVAAVAGLSLCTAAYQAENLRGGFLSVPRGVVEAADMAGFRPFQLFWRIRVPIAFKLTLPALVSEAIMILKSSSLVSVVGVVELTRMAQDLASSTYKPLDLYAAAGGLYLAINWLMAGLGRLLERRLRWGRA
ncbi:amino acid ABC transporter permease [Lichenifustis flavocetrariae]|uniref:Amino acid ABC transporter permease n=1 Tax=Lichenifustis flavocetrariae TaxID=2949735 RepID=A0AA41YYD9_9HYPH|nr:amino acid ABC transporter permease [Lichenifustis flavocetrariae]MCW6510859.1 amino acid ABC transporter permease [Lichenifustis flavocetrariae]